MPSAGAADHNPPSLSPSRCVRLARGLLFASLAMLLAPFGYDAAEAISAMHAAGRRATDAEAAQILAAAIGRRAHEYPQAYLSPGVRRSVVVQRETDPICELEEIGWRACTSKVDAADLLGSRFSGTIDAAMRALLVSLNRTRGRLPPIDEDWIIVVDGEVLTELFAHGRGWDSFFHRFPDTAGFVRASLPVLSADRREALLYIEHKCGMQCAEGLLVRLEQRDGRWAVVAEESVWLT